MSTSNKHITRKVIWGYLVLIVIAVYAVGYIYSVVQQVASDDEPDPKARQKVYLVTKTLSLLYESEALGQLVGPENDFRYFNRALTRAKNNMDSLRMLLTDSVLISKIDTIEMLIDHKRWNTRRLLETLNELNTGRLYTQNIQRAIAVQDSTLLDSLYMKDLGVESIGDIFSREIDRDLDSLSIIIPDIISSDKKDKDDDYEIREALGKNGNKIVVREEVQISKDTVVVPRKKRGFFRRLAAAFSRETQDTSIIVNRTRHIVTDTVSLKYNPSDTIVSVLRSLQDTVTFQHQILTEQLLQRAASLRYNNTIVTRRINQILRDIEEEEMTHSLARMQKRQDLVHETSRLIAAIAILSVIIAVIFLFVIIRDISKSWYYRTQLEKSKKYVEDLLHSREKLMLTISHDIRAPLSSIMGYIELLKRRHPDERQTYYLDNMTGSSQHILSLVNDLLDFHRLESGKMEIHAVPFRVSSLFREIYDSFRPMAEAKGLQFSLDMDTVEELNEKAYMGDPIRIRQVVSNLLSNAIKFTQEGSVLLAVYIHIDSEKQATLTVLVRDAGPGIPESERDRIFGDFTRLEGSESTEGFGLGLSITRRLITLMHGTLSLQSHVGKGSDFTIILPLPISDMDLSHTEEETEESSAAEDEKLEVLENKDIFCLLVDDDPLQLALTEELLKRSHVEVTCVTNPMSVTDVLRNSRFDAIITDIQMPGMDGYSLLKMIRNSGIEGTDTVPVIALSASVANENEHYIEAGFTAFLNKPFTAVQLISLLNDLLTVNLEPESSWDFSSLTAFAGEDSEACASILTTFSEETKKNLQLMKTALEENDRDASAKIAHKMIPLFSMLGANNLVQELRILEKNDAELTDAAWKNLLPSVIEKAEEVTRRADDEILKHKEREVDEDSETS